MDKKEIEHEKICNGNGRPFAGGGFGCLLAAACDGTIEPDDKKLFLEVIGISPRGNFAHVDFDAATGELLLAEEKFAYDDGSVEWKPFTSASVDL